LKRTKKAHKFPKSIKLYLDEDVRPLLARLLRERGYDAVSAIERKHIGITDEEQILHAINEQRVLLTHNIRHFVKLHKMYQDKHFGILLSGQIPFKLLVRRTLNFMNQQSIEGAKGQIIWLSSFERKKIK
jgi:predicted nuclease of predicted toxin-antitoxin system